MLRQLAGSLAQPTPAPKQGLWASTPNHPGSWLVAGRTLTTVSARPSSLAGTAEARNGPPRPPAPAALLLLLLPPPTPADDAPPPAPLPLGPDCQARLMLVTMEEAAGWGGWRLGGGGLGGCVGCV